MATEAKVIQGGLHAAAAQPVMLYGREMSANRRMPLNLDWVEEVRVNTSAVERRAANDTGAAEREEGVAGGVAAARDRVHGFDDAGGR